MNEKKIEELEQTIKQAQAQIEELKKEDEMPKFKYPMGEKVWFINGYGNIDWVYWTDTEIGKNMVHLGMIFFTKEEAEFEIERRKVIAELKLFAEPKDVEWNNINKKHFFIKYDTEYKKIFIDYHWIYKHGGIHFSSRKDCQKAIDFVGEDRIKKYYLRVGVE